MRKNREEEHRPQGNEAARDELGRDPRQTEPDSAGQSGDRQRLSTEEDADNESVEELEEPIKLSKRLRSKGLKTQRITPGAPHTPTMSTVVLTPFPLPESRIGKRLLRIRCKRPSFGSVARLR